MLLFLFLLDFRCLILSIFIIDLRHVCMMSFMLTLNMMITIVFPLLHFDKNISSVSLWPPATSIHRQFGVCFEMVLGLDGGMV